MGRESNGIYAAGVYSGGATPVHPEELHRSATSLERSHSSQRPYDALRPPTAVHASSSQSGVFTHAANVPAHCYQTARLGRRPASGCHNVRSHTKRGDWTVQRSSARRPRVLLVTDIVGFTAMVQGLGDAQAQRLIRSHNRLLRACVGAHDGVETAHTGDGMIVSFQSAARALACAVDMQRAVAEYGRAFHWPLRIRVGLHAGRPLPEEGRLFGLCVNIAVRVCLATDGSRVLLSEAVRQLAGASTLPFIQHGRVALKGIAKPISLHELLWRDA